jgi:CIC family chloride channel protein
MTDRFQTRSALRWLKWGVRLARWLHPTELQSGLLWAAFVGLIGGMSAILFRESIQGLLWLFTQHTGGIVAVALQLPWWHRIIIPPAGGFLAGLVLHYAARFVQRQPSTDYMEAVALGHGTIHLRPSLAKSTSSLLTIGSGGSIGREGAMVQLSATMASWFGRHFGRLSTPRLRLLVACGAAAGIAAVYDVTIAAALFVAEIVLGSIAMETLGPLLLAAVASSLTTRYFGGTEAYVSSPPFELISGWEIIPYLVMGLVLGVAAPGFVLLLRQSERVFLRWAPHIYLRLALGGLIVGLLSVPVPEVWGNGRSMVNLILQNPWPWPILAIVLVCKVSATAATAGSGAVGGVFTPTLSTGAMLGGLLGHAAVALWPGQTAGPQAYALVGMGGFLAAVTRAPLMSMLMVFEMTLNYGVIAPLMLVSVIAYYTASSLLTDSIYAEALRRKRGAAEAHEPKISSVSDLMQPSPPTVHESAPFREIARFFMSQPFDQLLVVSQDGHLLGTIALQDVKNELQDAELANLLTAADLVRMQFPTVMPQSKLTDALEAFRAYDAERLPVINNPHERILMGWISKTDLLLAIAEGLKSDKNDSANTPRPNGIPSSPAQHI